MCYCYQSPAFGNGTNYYMRLDLETKVALLDALSSSCDGCFSQGPGYYQGEHDVYIFTGDKVV